MNFTVAKAGNRWAILLDGQPYKETGRVYASHNYYARKRDALAAIPQIEARIAYEARLNAEDAAGTYVWTPEEQAGIQEYADALKKNETKFTMSGHLPVQTLARREHDSDARCIESWHATINGGKDNFICVEIRRRRAARVLAFELAGLHLDRARYDMVVQSATGKHPCTWTYNSREEAEAAKQEIVARAAEFGEGEYRK